MSHLNRQTVGAQAINEVFDLLKVSPKNGLSVSDARKRLKKYGPNRLREVQSRPAGKIFIDQFKSGIVVMLVVAVVLSMLFGDLVEAVAIAIVIVINGLIGFFTELKAARSMEALQELGSVDATVCRDGQIRGIPAEELVPGDLVQLDSGDVVTADIRLSEASKLQVDESSLTGESVPVSKQIEPLKKGEMPLAEQTNMVFKGTAITSGSGKGVVVTTGMQTELGHISSLVDKAEEEVTPLEKRLDSLGHGLIWLTVALAAIVAVIGLLSGREWLLMVETAIALAIAAIPEGLPIVATIALARGMHRMAKRNALMNTLSAVETLGSTTVICTDKTGTLTRNKMTMTRIVLAEREYEINNSDRPAGGAFSCDGEMVNAEEDPLLQEFLENGVLCNNAALPENSDKENGSAVGDPMEVALLAAGAKADIHRAALLETFPEEREEAFDSDTKMMATLHRGDEGLRVAVKGAAEAVLAVCTSIRTSAGERRPLDEEERDAWRDRNFQMAKQGLRLLAFATKTAASVDDEPYRDLTLLGYAGLLDPPRDDVQEAISLCQQAGIKLVMVTGDQAITAQKIGESVGMVSPEKSDHIRPGNILKPVAELSEDQQHEILNTTIFARVSPEEKLNLVTLYQNQHDIVAMTGDGVNDAPALEKADIGIAMGQHGTQVAREAADMILKDDAFSTIVEAIRYGRVIFGNIRKFVIFLLSGNAGEIMIVGLAMLLSAPLPLMPLQILYLNFIADVFPALALGVGMGTSDVMHHPPRDPKEPVMTHRHWFAITGYGVLIAAAVLTAFAIALQFLGLDQQTSVTISFLTLATARLWHVFNMRDFDAPILNNDVTRNPWVWGALGICLVLILLAVYVPALSDILRLVRPTAGQWLLIIGCSVLPLVLGQALKALKLLCRRNN